MKRKFGFVAIILLVSAFTLAVFFSPIGRSLFGGAIRKSAASKPTVWADSARTDERYQLEPLPARRSTTPAAEEFEEPTQPATAPAEYFGEPKGLAAGAGREFAFDLYAHLAASPDADGKNLFFSPYSISSVLIMAAEGARGETAEQMGHVLHFPQTLHREGPEAEANPWDLTPLHTDMAAVNASLNGMLSGPERRKVRNQIVALRRELEAANAAPPPTSSGDQHDDYAAFLAQSEKASHLVAQIDELNKLDPYELSIANALWVEKTYPIEQSYADVISRFYQSGAAFPIDFIANSEVARHQINAWVKKQTHGRLDGAVPEDAVHSETRLMLTSAIYFKGEWSEPFPESRTSDDDFVTATAKVRTPLMRNDTKAARYGAFNADGSFFPSPKTIPESKTPEWDDPLLYPSRDGFQILTMPYKGARLSMVILLPRNAYGLAALEKTLTAARFEEWISKLARREVSLVVPKFRLETSYNMVPLLQAMGMNRAFARSRGPDGAQFDGLCANPDPTRKLYINGVLHRAFVEVNEKGTEAAAVTTSALGIDPAAASIEVPFIPTFRADRPFIFAIRDTKTRSILFLGRVVDPRS